LELVYFYFPSCVTPQSPHASIRTREGPNDVTQAIINKKDSIF